MEIQGSNAHPSLNVIERQPTSATQTPILFVHGANMSAWCWDENFMSFFAKKGHPTYAVSLRGHGNSGGQHQLASNSITDYVTDIQRVIDEIGVTPILIGHSLGCLVIQNYIENTPVPACVLLAPIPVHGLLPSILDLSLYNTAFYTPLNLLQLFGDVSTVVEMARKFIFSGHVSDEVVIRYCAQLQPESPKALLDSLWLGLPSKKNPFDVPMLALAADEDTFFRADHIKKTAAAYKADYLVMKNTSHAMMLDSDWRHSANAIGTWLNEVEFIS